MGLKNKQLENILKEMDPKKGIIYSNGPGSYDTIPTRPEYPPSPEYKREQQCWI